MSILPEIPKDQLECFKKNVKDWLSYNDQISVLELQIKELKRKKNKEIEPKITQFMRSYNISDLNTTEGKLRCNERKTRSTVSINYLKLLIKNNIILLHFMI